jgi:acyl carrier protein
MTTTVEVLNFIQKNLSLGEIDLATAMGAIRGWDSLRHIELILDMSENFNIEIPPDRIGELTQVTSILDFFREEGILSD